jgi:hypothetical protein
MRPLGTVELSTERDVLADPNLRSNPLRGRGLLHQRDRLFWGVARALSAMRRRRHGVRALRVRCQ